jgi:hypothetical protein
LEGPFDGVVVGLDVATAAYSSGRRGG